MLGIISIIITLRFLIGLNCSIFFLNLAVIRFAWLVAFLKWTQFSHFDFTFFIILFNTNLVCFDFVHASNSQKSWFDIV